MQIMETTMTIQKAINRVSDFIAKTADAKTTRASNFSKYQKFTIDGNQWSNIEQPEGRSVMLTFNQSEEFIETYQTKLFPRNPQTGVLEVGVKIFETDKTKKEKYEQAILETYENEQLGETLIEQAQNFFIGGDACLYFPRDDKDPKKTKIISLDPQKCYIGWNGNKISQFAFEDEIAQIDLREDIKTNWIKELIKKYVTKTDGTEKFEKIDRITYWDTEFQIIKIKDEVKIYKNTDGIIPFQWIPNKPKAHSHEGISEIKKLVELEQNYNQRGSDFGERIRKNTKAKQVLLTDKKATDIDQDQINDGIIKLGKDDDAKLLTIQESPEILKYMEMLERRMNIKMATNQATSGEIKSNVSSLSLMFYYSALLDRIGLKRVYWDQAFRELNKAILRNAFDLKETPKNSPVYQPMLMQDKETQIKNTILLLDKHLISYKDAIDEIHGAENAEEKFTEIKKEYEELSQIEGFVREPKQDSEMVEL